MAESQQRQTPATAPMDLAVTVTSRGPGSFYQAIDIGPHHLAADEPVNAGGSDAAPSPYDYLLAALGSCTAMTVRAYADRKHWPLERVVVRLWHRRIPAQDCAGCATRTGQVDQIEMAIDLTGPLSDVQRTRLRQIAEHCPVHRTLQGEIRIETRAA